MKLSTFLAGVFLITLVSCKTSMNTASLYDDVYQSHLKSEASAQIITSDEVNTSQAGASQQYQQSVSPQQERLSERAPENQSSSEGTLYYPESAEESYENDDYSSGYYDYSFEERINRFHRPSIGFSYFHPIYSGYCCGPYYGSSFSIYYGWGWPYGSLAFGWGWGYPYYYRPWYYDPWYFDPWFYDPWFYPGWYSWYYYPWNSSYWYWRGFWDGYYAGNWFYPERYYPNYYYGPRTTRGSSLIGSTETRESRISGQDSQFKSTTVSTRQSRIGGELEGQMKTTGEATPERSSRMLHPDAGIPEIQQPQPSSRETRQEKFPAPSIPETNPLTTESKQRSERDNVTVPQVITPERSTRSEPAREGLSPERSDRPQNQGAPDVIHRERRYAKPESNDLQQQSKPRIYTPPSANRPRSSNEFVVPSQQPFQLPSRQPRDAEPQTRENRDFQSPVKGTVRPSRSEIQFPESSRDNQPSSPPPRISRPGNNQNEQVPFRTPGNISVPSGSPRSTPPQANPPSGNSPRSSGFSTGSSSNNSGNSGERRGR